MKYFNRIEDMWLSCLTTLILKPYTKYWKYLSNFESEHWLVVAGNCWWNITLTQLFPMSPVHDTTCHVVIFIIW